MDLLLLVICLAAGFLTGLFVTTYIMRSIVFTIPMTRTLAAEGIHRHVFKAYLRTTVRILAMSTAITLAGIAIYRVASGQGFYCMVYIVVQPVAMYIMRKSHKASSKNILRYLKYHRQWLDPDAFTRYAVYNAPDLEGADEIVDRIRRGWRTDKDIESVRQAAERGEAAAQYALGRICQSGKSKACNGADALKWYIKSADQGYADAQFTLGIIYTSGRITRKNPVEARIWFKRAAKQGHTPATVMLEWLRRTDEQGHAPMEDMAEEPVDSPKPGFDPVVKAMMWSKSLDELSEAQRHDNHHHG